MTLANLDMLGDRLSEMFWTWDGVSATPDRTMRCVEVRTTALARKLEQIRERERRDLRQSF